MDLVNHLPKESFKSASDLLLGVLGEKFIPLLGAGEKTDIALVESFVSENCFSVFSDNLLVGILAFKTKNSGFFSITIKNLIKIYGFWGGLVRAFRLSILEHEVRGGEVYIEAVAVNEDYRSMGVGRQLIEALVQYAKGKSFTIVSLEVIDTNPRALSLYERIGFEVIKTSSIKPFNKLLNLQFEKVFLMEKKI